MRLDAILEHGRIWTGDAARPTASRVGVIGGRVVGIDEELELEPELTGNAYTSDKPRVPGTMGAARERFHTSEVTRAALGDEVVEHYANMADIELAAYNAAVTDWELVRGFERL